MAELLSLVDLFTLYIRRSFTKAGLTKQSVSVDSQTVIHFWCTKPEVRDVRKPSLLFIHGFGPVSLWQWQYQVPFFAPHFNVFVPDLVFFGESTTISWERSEIFQAESLAKLLEKLAVERCSVVGTSYGGFVAYHMAKKYPDKVDCVVIASSGINMKRNLHKEIGVEKISDLLLPQTASQVRKLFGTVVSWRLSVLPDFILNDFISKMYNNRNHKLELLEGLTLGRDDSPSISTLHQKVLLIWGEKDKIFPVEMAWELQRLLGETVKLAIVKNSSHTPQIQNPSQFNNLVKDFLLTSSQRSLL